MKENKTTKLLEYFKTVSVCGTSANYTYCEFPLYFRWVNNTWVKRVRHSNVLSRIDFCSPKNIELFCLRILLINVPGVTSFEYLLNYKNVVHKTFREVAIARNLFSDNYDWCTLFEEAVSIMLPKEFRRVFCSVCVYNEIENPDYYLQLYFTHLTEDFITNEKQEKCSCFMTFL